MGLSDIKYRLKSTAGILLFPAITGILLAAASMPSKLYWLNFLAFIPLLTGVEQLRKVKKPYLLFLLQLFLALSVFFIWTGRWVLQTANMGFLLGLLLIVPFVVLISPYILFKKNEAQYALLYFLAAWLTAEMIQSYFQLGSPFFNLGHSIGKNPNLIQWYEYTGAVGGSLWVLAVNILLFSFGKALVYSDKYWYVKGVFVVAILLAPIIVSILIYRNYEERGRSAEVLVVHPSTNNADVKYQKNIYELLDIYLGILKPGLTAETDYVVLPETALTNTGWIKDYNRNLVFQHWFDKTSDFPNLKLVTGAIAYEAIPDVEKIKGYEKIPGIRYSENYKTWYYTYNTALFLERERPVQIRVKDKLVPYQEYAPYPRFMPRLKPVGIDFQFSTREKNREVFIEEKNRKTAALICYELVYGKQFYEKAREGAEAFFVLLNEGWYDDPKVPQQFLQLSAIRAIENRRSIAHSSNLGISAIINQKGEIMEKTNSEQPGYLRNQLRLNKSTTLYTSLGNYIGAIAAVIVLVGIFRGLVILKPKVKS
ncbi:apolipoprotein N-acyltransferase [uncultured Draconibacterium sp.]|uniref:apolipoprotein N-acyltransferase n=1 Tax=uncultured Draconibacterium sp. TaxID=1573823 RepID=UPI0029C8CB2F|nr:apolipoprotein N-acyltransferase [uncultured Draconibacterium sp.]